MLDDGRVVMLGFDEVCEECPPSADYVRVNMEIEGFVLTRTDQGTLVQRIAQVGTVLLQSRSIERSIIIIGPLFLD
jgi:hypothetical protein